MGQSRPLFVYFLNTIAIIQFEKRVDGVLGFRTQGHRMVGADETTELWRPPAINCFIINIFWLTGIEPGADVKSKFLPE